MSITFEPKLDAAAMGGEPSPALASPTRNKYFYGKLLDAHHLQLEQHYFLDQSRRMNRMGLGFGVLCGLGLELAADGTKIIVHPGVAIDGLGREIVVPAPICIDPAALADEGDGGADAKEGFTISLCYHECETEPAPALVSECDVRERCVNGLIRERFRIHLHAGVPTAPPYLGAPALLGILVRRVALLEQVLGVGADGGTGDATHGAYATPMSSYGIGTPAAAGGIHDAHGPLAPIDILSDPTLTELYSCAAPSDECVVLGTVTPATDDGTELVVDGFTYRRTIMSNDALFELILGLTVLVERCCGLLEPTTTVEVTGDLQSAKAKTSLDEPIVVTVHDAEGEPVADASVTFAVTSTSGGSFDPAQADTDGDGTASSVWTLGDPGPQTAQVTVGDQTVDLTATSQ